MGTYIVRPKNASPVPGTGLIVKQIWVDPIAGVCRIELTGDGDMPRSTALEIEKKLAVSQVIWEKEGQPFCFSQEPPCEELPKVKTEEAPDLKSVWHTAVEKVTGEERTVALWLERSRLEWQGQYLFIHVSSRIGWEIIETSGFLPELQQTFAALWPNPVTLRLSGAENWHGEDEPEAVPMPEEAKAPTRNDAKDNPERIYIGRAIKGENRPMKEITEEERQVIVEGRIIQIETRELRSGRSLLTMEVADADGALSIKHFFPDEGAAASFTRSSLSKGSWVRAKGRVEFDKFSQELTMQLDHLMGALPPAKREDKSEIKRVELHAHTQMSTMDAVIPAGDLIRRAIEWGHPAIAITDHGVVQSFPEAQQVQKKSKGAIKIIYGVEGYLIDEDINKANHIIILAKNSVGLQNLYRLISYSHLQYMYKSIPRIPRALLMEHREGLILGSACESGELFEAVLEGLPAERVEEMARFYDYLEIQPVGNNDFLVRKGIVKDRKGLQELNKKIVALGEKLDIPVCATCDVHFLEPQDEVYRRILMAGIGFSDADAQPPLYFRTTEEMLEEFTYLSKEKAYEVVVTQPLWVADQVEMIEPIPEKTYFPEIPGANDQVRQMAEVKAKSLYGQDLPELIAERLEMELQSIISNGFAVLYLISHKLVKKSLDDGYLVGSRGSVGSSFVATMMDITEVNPLPPHWLCKSCCWSEFDLIGQYGGGFDLPDRNCPHCNIPASKEGHDIPFAVFMGFKGDKVPDIDLNFSGEYQSIAHKYTEELFGKDNVFRAGTISTIADRTAYGFAKKYCEERQRPSHTAEINRLVSGCTGVKRTTGQHPGGIIVVPRDMDIHHFTPVQYPADKKDSGTITTHFDYHSIHDQLVKLDILGHDDPTVIRMLEDLTGLDPRTIPFDDPKTLSLFSSLDALGLTEKELGMTVGTLGIPEFGTRFVREMLEDTHPQYFSELVRISGFSHGTDVWLNNAQDLIRNGTAKLGEAISTRDDIMVYLMHKGVEAQKAFAVMESVRKGKGVSDSEADILRQSDVPEWYIESCRKIQYMFPKAHAVAYVTMAFRIAYCKVHYPLAFYSSYFTVRADDFDASLIVKGTGPIREALRQLDQGGNKLTAKEKSFQTILEVSLEMNLRGFQFESVSLYESDPTLFVIRDNGLLPPLVSLKGLGETAAKNIVVAREKGPFSSIEDLCNRSRIGKDVQEILEKHGCLSMLPKANQIELFG